MKIEHIILLIINERLYKAGIISDEQKLKVLDQILSGNDLSHFSID